MPLRCDLKKIAKLSCSEVMEKSYGVVQEDATVEQVLYKICSEKLLYHTLLVFKGEEIRGVIEEKDLLKIVETPLSDSLIGQIFIKVVGSAKDMMHQVHLVKEDDLVKKALNIMIRHNITTTPVTDDAGKVKGIISFRAIMAKGFDHV